MEGANTQEERRPKDNRRQEGQPGNRQESDTNSRDKNRNRRSGNSGGGGRRGVYRFDDQLEHAICQSVTHRAPQGFPATARSELATMRQIEVARTDSSILICDGLHEGNHFWPNGDEVV